MFKRYALVLAMAVALIAGFGCTKGTGTDGQGGEGEIPADVRAAMDRITNAKIFFAFDKYDITQESQEVLKSKANDLRNYPSIVVQIQGHADERGTEEYNLALGERRARAAYEFLLKLGVSANQMQMISYGKERPAVMGTGEAVWAQNRRDEFVIIGY